MNENKSFNLISFTSIFFISLGFAFLWVYIGEPWEVLADGTHYMKMYNGELAPSPFGYRVLTPFLASLLPWSAKINFAFITLVSLSITTSLLVQYIVVIGGSTINKILVALFWITSFPFIYYGTTFIRADAIMYLLIALTILLSKYRISSLILLFLLAIGTFAHEMVMIVIPALWLDKIFNGSLTGGKSYSYKELLILTVAVLSVFIVSRMYIETSVSTAKSYLDTPYEMVAFVINYSGGIIKHMLRIYATFGPLFLFAIVYVFFIKKSFSDFMVFIGLLLLIFLATFLATDTLRVVAILFFPIITYASYFLITILNNGYKRTAIALIIFQLIYSYIMFLHLRTFESSTTMNILVACISLITVIVLIWLYKRKIYEHRLI